VEDLLAERGIDVSHETIRFWWNRFGPMFATEIRRKRVERMRAFTHWRWHLDEVYVKIGGGVLESFATKARDKAAALKFMKKLMRRHGSAKVITTNGLRSYRAAMKEIGNAKKQVIGHWANNRVENSHLPIRRRERAMNRFRGMKTLQRFSSVHASVHNLFNQERHLISRRDYKQRRTLALAEWRSVMA
jgi:putative transposase